MLPAVDGRFRQPAAIAGIAFMLLGVFLFAVNDTLGKWLVASFAVGQILLIRSVAALIVIAPFAWRERRTIARPERIGIHILRAVVSTLEVALFYWALFYLPLADVMTFYLAGPVYVTALSAIFLKEKVGWMRWSAVLVGFCGVLVALGPNLATASTGALIAIAGSLTYAALIITTRVVSSASGTTLITWQTVGTLIGGLILAPFDWRPPTGVDFLLLGLLGFVSMTAHVCINQALKIAEASTVVPYQYTLIVWAILFGYVFFGDVPSVPLLVGAATIVLSGLFIFLREQKRGRPAAAGLATDVVPDRDAR